jgi:hypothetical protein
MNIINFNGRSDGIGNRIEQLIYLNNFCKKHNKICNYYWNNTNARKDRKYDISINFSNMVIQDKKKHNRRFRHPKLYKYRKNLEVNDYNFKFGIPDIESETFFAIHIRSTDRISKKMNGDFIDKQTFKKCLEKSIYLANKSSGKNIYICGDSNKYIEYITSKIKNKNILKCETKIDNVSNEWIDFYYLTKAYKIIMCSRYSSFSSTASILGNSKLISFFDERDTSLNRLKANVIVDKI